VKFHHTVLDNGLTLIGEENPDARSIAAGYFVRTGARDETHDVSGVSHFLEHMLFKGTPRRSADDVNREFDEIGADYNAFTGEEYTVYYGAVLPEHQHRLVDLLTDMMRPTLRVEDFDMEKQVILEEIALYKDRPQFLVIDEARSTYYQGHPLGQSVLGTEESITNLSRDQMLGYWERRYAPNNLVLALTGKFDWDAAVSQAKAAAGGWKRSECPRGIPEFVPHPRVSVVARPSVHRVHLALVAPGFPAQDDRRWAADLIGDMIGGGEGSRLYWSLVEPGLADSVRLGHDEEDGVGAYFGYASCDPERAQTVADRIRTVFERAMTDGFSEEEIDRARRKAASGRVLHDETPRGRLFHVGFDWQYRQEHLPLDDAVDRYLAVSRDAVQECMALRPFDALNIVCLGPVESLS
jgi:predicted Zn-dependent peptidase